MPCEEQRQAPVIVQMGVAHGAAVENKRMVQQVAVSIGSVSQAFKEVTHLSHVIAIDIGKVRNQLRPFAVVRKGVEGSSNTALPKDTEAGIVAHLERAHAGGVGS